MIPNDWLQYVANKERELASRPADAPRRPQGVGRDRQGRGLMSSDQRQALRGSLNLFRASYDGTDESKFVPTRPENSETFTMNVGGNCEPDSPHGRRTR